MTSFRYLAYSQGTAASGKFAGIVQKIATGARQGIVIARKEFDTRGKAIRWARAEKAKAERA